MPKSNDFQILIEWIYLPSFKRIDKTPFKLSSGQAYPSKKHIIGRNVTAAFSKKFPRAIAHTCQIWKESAQQSQSYKENKTELTEPAEPDFLLYTNKCPTRDT